MLERFIKLYNLNIIEDSLIEIEKENKNNKEDKKIKKTNKRIEKKEKIEKKEIININKIEFKILKEIIEILEIFKGPSIAVQALTYPTTNLIYPFILIIREKLNNYKIKENNNIEKDINILLKNAVNTGLEKLEKWFPISINKDTIKKTYINIFIASILDPKSKNLLLNTSNNRLEGWGLNTTSINLIIKKFKKLYNKTKKEYISYLISNFKIKKINSNTISFFINYNSYNEIDLYLKDSNTNLNYLEFYSRYYYKYPILTILARNFLSIPATSAYSEILFSISNSIKTDSRSTLEYLTYRDLLCLKSWDWYKRENIEEFLYIRVDYPKTTNNT
jgi:hypothetical protein